MDESFQFGEAGVVKNVSYTVDSRKMEKASRDMSFYFCCWNVKYGREHIVAVQRGHC